MPLSSNQLTQSIGSVGGKSRQSGVPTVQSQGQGSFWSTHFDEAAGLEYYVNDFSGESTYEKPLELLNDSAYYSGASGGSVDRGYQHSAAIDEWTEQWDDQAQARYWYNSRTKEATWTQPVELQFNGSQQSRPESVA